MNATDVRFPDGPLVDAATLRARLDRPDHRPVVLDVRWHLGGPSGEDDYDAGHLPGAVFVDLDHDLAGPPGPAGRHPLPAPDGLEDTLRRAGVDPGTTVVVYDGGDGPAAARAWWVLRWAGLPDAQVRVLDGGFPAWTAAGGEVTAAGPGVRPTGGVTVAGGAMPVLDAERAGALGADPAATLLDGRAPARYAGAEEPMDPVAGHVPGAVNLPVSTLLTPDGFWREPAELAERLRAAGVGGGPVGGYCGSGVSAAMLVLALQRAGLRTPDDPAALYVGSWSHWCRTGRPVAVGPEPHGSAAGGGADPGAPAGR